MKIADRAKESFDSHYSDILDDELPETFSAIKLAYVLGYINGAYDEKILGTEDGKLTNEEVKEALFLS